MKAEIVNKQEGFKPVTVQITFEKQVELELFRSLMGANLRIPQMLFSNRGITIINRELLGNLMSNIYTVLYETKTN